MGKYCYSLQVSKLIKAIFVVHYSNKNKYNNGTKNNLDDCFSYWVN